MAAMRATMDWYSFSAGFFAAAVIGICLAAAFESGYRAGKRGPK